VLNYLSLSSDSLISIEFVSASIDDLIRHSRPVQAPPSSLHTQLLEIQVALNPTPLLVVDLATVAEPEDRVAFASITARRITRCSSNSCSASVSRALPSEPSSPKRAGEVTTCSCAYRFPRKARPTPHPPDDARPRARPATCPRPRPDPTRPAAE
jgi:hypothetical protein